MQTTFSLVQLADPDMAASEQILRTCVHCGFCTATCPTFALLGDELDSPRGRIYLIKDMLEHPDRPIGDAHVKHIDRCLSCLSCMTTCPSGVHYMHLVDHARNHIEEHYQRPWFDRMLRQVLGMVLPSPTLFRFALIGAWFGKLVRGLLPSRVAPLIDLAPSNTPGPSWVDKPQVFPAEGERRMRVALMPGCAQQVLNPGINEATVRLLTRHGVEVVIAEGGGCCGALNHHLGQHDRALTKVKRNIEAWERAATAAPLDAIVITASGCGTTVKDYGWMLREDPAYAERAARIASLAKDVTEVVERLPLAPLAAEDRPTVVYHSACSMQHGQKLKTGPQALLRQAGFTVREPAESHLCCGSAGTYNLLQAEIAARLKERKVGHLEATKAALIATGNIGCMTQIASGTALPVVHTVELLDWATGGPQPSALG
ncbi:MAG: glycolate oxidase iron-sulfur subunit [Alphaproteobacteria bacterium]|nr:MAG: glycolate oxidase iron-sulfur subunit [Alphaproteobacteria bacterium]